jgi:hypothetical protein
MVAILEKVKKGLGVVDAFFDDEIAINIDSAITSLHQNNCCDYVSVYTNRNLTEEELFNNNSVDIGSAMQYIVVQTRILFDPPTAALLKVLEDRAQECLWRARTNFDKGDQIE